MIVLRFKHDATAGEWQFDGTDEPALRGLLERLDAYAVDPASGGAALTAEAAGTAVGAWSRGGAAHLASLIFRERRTPPWTDVHATIQAAVMDPHTEEH